LWKRSRRRRGGGGGGSPGKKSTIQSKKNGRKRTRSSDDEAQVEDPNFDPDIVAADTPTFSQRGTGAIPELEKPWVIKSLERSAERARKKAEAKAAARALREAKSKAPAQDSVQSDLKEISERIANLIQVKNMGLSTPDNQRTLKKLIEQKNHVQPI